MALNQPSKWEWVNFEEAVEIWDSLRKPINSKERAQRISDKNQEELYPYYGATGQVGYIDSYLSDGEYVLLGEDGAPFLDPVANKAYLIQGKAWVNNHAHVLRSKYNNKFLCYYLNQFNYNGFVTGTTRYKLTQAAMKRIPIPVPSPNEQERIVSKIEELFSRLDASVTELQTAKEKLKVYRQSVLKEAFLALPKESYLTLDSISDKIFDGPFGSNLKTSDYVESGVRVVRLENLKDGWFDDSKKSFISPEKYAQLSKHTIYPSDLIISTFISNSIKVCQMPKSIGNAINKADCVVIRLKEDVLPQFIMYYLMTKQLYNTLIHQVHGATRPRINTKQIKSMYVPNPKSCDQTGIVNKIQRSLSICDSIEQSIDTSLQRAEALRQSILKQAFEGKL